MSLPLAMAEQQRGLVWLITGCSSGFGRRLVHSALSRGERVIGTGRSLPGLADLPPSDRLHRFQLDVTDDETKIQATVEQAIAIWGKIDVLVNNAGYGRSTILEEGGVQELKKQYETNVFGVLKVTNAVLPYMRARRSGTIVIIGSRSAWRVVPGLGNYCSSKAAVHALGECLAAELKQFGIRVLIVAPGVFLTEGIYRHPVFKDNTIQDYNGLRENNERWINGIKGGDSTADPSKAMDVLVDVVRGEGVANGRDMPLYLVLGEDAAQDLRNTGANMSRVLDEWEDVTRSVHTPACTTRKEDTES